MATIPVHLLKDRYWHSTLHLFSKHPKLKGVFTTKYFDFNSETIEVDALRKQTKAWSSGEKIMFKLALHLFNERHRFNLSDLDYLDDQNKKLAFEAIRIRFNY